MGQGTYSNVYKARDRDTNKIVALKKVRFDISQPDCVKFMAREMIFLHKLDHPNIIKLQGLATSRMHYSLYLVFDFMETDLATISFVVKRGLLNHRSQFILSYYRFFFFLNLDFSSSSVANLNKLCRSNAICINCSQD